MPWANVGYQRPAEDDTKITDLQTRELRRLCEKIDRQPSGAYAELTWDMSRLEASIRIDKLKKKAKET